MSLSWGTARDTHENSFLDLDLHGDYLHGDYLHGDTHQIIFSRE